MIVQFKREFSFEDICSFWEVIWSNHLTEDFHLYVALAILIEHSQEIRENDTPFDGILKVSE